MVKHFGLLITVLGLSGALGCAQDPVESNTNTKVVPVPESTLIYARAAVEVKKIKISEMSRFEASVERMGVGERTALWRTLEALHGNAGSRDADRSRSEPSVDEGYGCTLAECSHSTPNCLVAQWCCAFGEDALFYAYDEDINQK